MGNAAAPPVTDDRDVREQATELLRGTATCTLATATVDGGPEAATVRFVADDEFNVYINTATTYRKYANMAENPRVAVVVNGDTGNLQLEGCAAELQGSDAEMFRAQYVEKYGPSKYLTHETSTCFAITTDWVRLLVDGTFPPEHAMVVGEGHTDPH
jgi:nitroimidazol reductase NimA-like FMN-containing flavoprotein (pyridoxamine 5'-phosphate oxidase superfamily)